MDEHREGSRMGLNRLVAIRKGLHGVIMGGTWIGGAALILMVLVTFANVIARYVLKKPLIGAVEMTQLLLVVTAFLAIPYTEVRRQHVTFDEVVSLFPRRLRAATIGVMYFLVGVYALIMSWQEALLAVTYVAPRMRVTDVLKIPIAPAMFIIAVGALLWGIELFLNALSPLEAAQQEDIKKQEGLEDEVGG
jgi:TRAP-type C4-dicarboxylate transport system permease small subunit